jgi:probable phosphomutase (TIGR03848 family)
VTTVLLVRHGLTATTGHVLTGWMPGIALDDRGRAQAAALAARLAPLHLDAIVSSPLERCMQTAAAIAADRDGQPVITEDRVGECRYGDWTGRPLKKLAREKLWRVVQAHPSAVTFPGPAGESMPDMQHRAVAAVRDWNARLGPDATYLICSHGDVIKAIVADSLGLHLDQSQRIQADPCSLTVIRYTPLRPFLIRMNDRGGGVEDLMPRATGRGAPAHDASASDAAVGGGSGGADYNGPADGRADMVTGLAGTKATQAGIVPPGPSAPAIRQESADTRG